LAGEETLVRKVFEATVSARKTVVDYKNRAEVILTNNSSIEWLLCFEGQKMVILEPNSSTMVRLSLDGSKAVTVLNTWCGENKHLVHEFKLD
jgi:hypothetical protein